MTNLDILLKMLNRATAIRDGLRIAQIGDPGDLNYNISQYAGVPWANFFEDREATENLLKEMCPDWIYIGEEDRGPYRAAKLGHTKTGELRGTNRVSNPSTLSLLTLVFETHIYLLSVWIEEFLNGNQNPVDMTRTSPYKGIIAERLPHVSH